MLEFGFDDSVFEALGSQGCHPVWTSGLALPPYLAYPPPCIDEKIVWDLVGETGALFKGICFGDGSGLHGFLPQTRRCGWGVLAAHLDQDGIFQRTTQAHGSLHFPTQVVP